MEDDWLDAMENVMEREDLEYMVVWMSVAPMGSYVKVCEKD